MKKVIYLLFAVVLFTAASNKLQERYFSASPEIETAKSIMKHYTDANWEAMKVFYADTAKMLHNVPNEKAISVDASIEYQKQDHELFSSISFGAEEDFYEMVVTDDDETWVNYWGLWKGTLKANGEEFEIPVHLTMQFVDGKIVREVGYWNNTAVVLALQKIEAETKLSDD